MLQNNGVLIVLCLAALIGLGVPAMLVAGLRRGGSLRQFDMLRKAGKTAANPWGKEDQNLAELAKQVEKLKERS